MLHAGGGQRLSLLPSKVMGFGKKYETNVFDAFCLTESAISTMHLSSASSVCFVLNICKSFKRVEWRVCGCEAV